LLSHPIAYVPPSAAHADGQVSPGTPDIAVPAQSIVQLQTPLYRGG
jgi:hypothetical protein